MFFMTKARDPQKAIEVLNNYDLEWRMAVSVMSGEGVGRRSGIIVAAGCKFSESRVCVCL